MNRKPAEPDGPPHLVDLSQVYHEQRFYLHYQEQ